MQLKNKKLLSASNESIEFNPNLECNKNIKEFLDFVNDTENVDLPEDLLEVLNSEKPFWKNRQSFVNISLPEITSKVPLVVEIKDFEPIGKFNSFALESILQILCDEKHYIIILNSKSLIALLEFVELQGFSLFVHRPDFLLNLNEYTSFLLIKTLTKPKVNTIFSCEFESIFLKPGLSVSQEVYFSADPQQLFAEQEKFHLMRDFYSVATFKHLIEEQQFIKLKPYVSKQLKAKLSPVDDLKHKTSNTAVLDLGNFMTIKKLSLFSRPKTAKTNCNM